jgi:glutaconyl-CoA decarboxylase
MRRFRVHINGKTYEVEVEELETPTAGAERTAPVETESRAPSRAETAPAQTAEPVSTPSSAGSSEVTAPLPGVILELHVEEGEQVAEDQVIVILEAMKMENELTAPQAGTVSELRVSEGDTVEPGEVLVVLE